MESLGLSLWPLVLAFSAVGGSVLVPLLWRCLLRPWWVARRLQAQGVRGCPFRPVVGNLPELFGTERARSKDPALAASTRATQFFIDGTTKFGKAWMWMSGSRPRVVLADPDMVRRVLGTQSAHFKKTASLKHVRFLGSGLLTSDGSLWARQRRLIAPAFQMGEIRRLYPTMLRTVLADLTLWDAAIAASPGAPLRVDSLLCELSIKIISLTAFGKDFGSKDSELLSQIRASFDLCISISHRNRVLSTCNPLHPYLPLPSNLAMWRAERFLHEAMGRIIQSRLNQVQVVPHSEILGEPDGARGGGGVDLLQLIINSCMGDPGQGEEAPWSGRGKESGGGGVEGVIPLAMGQQQLMDECMTFLAAGHETTATLLTWTMMLLGYNQHWQKRGRDEVSSLRDACKESTPERQGDWAPEWEMLGSMPVVTCILQETLRLCTPVPLLSRTCAEDCQVGEGLVVPAGCDVVISPEVLHLTEEYWGGTAHLFDPTRFLKGSASRGPSAAAPAGAYMPFGLGPRACIGQAFAMVEAKLILCMLLLRYNWTMAEEYRHHPVMTLTTKPKHGLPLVLSRN